MKRYKSDNPNYELIAVYNLPTEIQATCNELLKSEFGSYLDQRMEKTKDLCDDLPTSLAYMDTSVSPHKFLGHVLIEKRDDKIKSLEFDLIAVAKDLRGRKIGKSMMKEVEVWAVKRRFDCFYLTAYKGVVGFYKKCGYIEDENLTDDGDLPTLKKEVVIDNEN